MDVRLNHVVAVARSGSFTAAAQQIGVTQSAVTKGVADMERQLGYAIFYRTARGAILTEQGRSFVERAARLLDDARELMMGRTGLTDPFAGVLRLGVCPASLEWRLIEPIAALQSRHPAIKFEVSAASFERMVQLLRNGGVDLVLGFEAAFSDWPEFVREPIAALRSAPFVRRGHPLDNGRPLEVDQIAEFDFVSPSDSRPYGSLFRSFVESRGKDWRAQIHTVDFFPLISRMVANSDAIGVVALSHAKSARFQSEFTLLEIGGGEISNLYAPANLCCAYRERWELSAAARAFIRAARSDAELHSSD